jgi:intracellular septation protein A
VREKDRRPAPRRLERAHRIGYALRGSAESKASENGDMNRIWDRIVPVVRFALAEFGPLIGFWLLAATLGTKAAIAGSVSIIIADALWRRHRGLAFTRIYLLTSGLTLVFGAVDLMSATPFMLKYESVITNAVTGLVFAAGAYGPKPIIQEVAEQRQGGPFPEGPDIRRFFQMFTLFWAAYFFVKSIFYFWMAWTMPMLQAMALRSVIGSVSLGLMIAFSATQGRRMFMLCRKWGLLPTVERAAQASDA